MHRAEQIFEQEREKAAAVVSAAKRGVRDIGKEAREDLDEGEPGDKTAVQALTEKAKASGQRVVDAATDKAQEQNLGKISS